MPSARTPAWTNEQTVTVQYAENYFCDRSVTTGSLATSGCEIGGHDHGSGLILGRGEPVDLEGAVSKLAELFSVAAAFVLVGRRPA